MTSLAGSRMPSRARSAGWPSTSPPFPSGRRSPWKKSRWTFQPPDATLARPAHGSQGPARTLREESDRGACRACGRQRCSLRQAVGLVHGRTGTLPRAACERPAANGAQPHDPPPRTTDRVSSPAGCPCSGTVRPIGRRAEVLKGLSSEAVYKRVPRRKPWVRAASVMPPVPPSTRPNISQTYAHLTEHANRLESELLDAGPQ